MWPSCFIWIQTVCKGFFKKYHHCVKRFGSRSGPTFLLCGVKEFKTVKLFFFQECDQSDKLLDSDQTSHLMDRTWSRSKLFVPKIIKKIVCFRLHLQYRITRNKRFIYLLINIYFIDFFALMQKFLFWKCQFWVQIMTNVLLEWSGSKLFAT